MFREETESLQSHVVTVSSQDEPGNTATNFIVRLSRPIKTPLNLYDVGLLSIRMEEIENQQSVAVQSEAPIGSLFPGWVKPDIRQYSFSVKRTNLPRKVMTQLDEWAQKNLIPLRLGALLCEDDTVLFHIKNTSKKQERIVLPSEIAKLFGFRLRSFELGTHWSETSIGKDSIDLIDPANKYIFETIEHPYKDSLITVERLYSERFYIPYKMQDYHSFLEAVEEEFKLEGYKLQVDINILGYCEIRLDSRSGKLDEYVVFPDKLAQAMGFSYSLFEVGSHAASSEFDHNIFNSFKNNERLYFEIGTYRQFFVQMSEPVSLLYTDVLHELNSVFERFNYDDLRPTFVVENGKLNILNVPEKTFITLPKRVIDFFQVNPTTVFKAETSVEVGEPIVEEEKELEAEQRGEGEIPPVSSVQTTRLLVLVDVAGYEFYRGRMLPLVQELEFDNKSLVNVVFNPVLYVPLNCSQVNQIRFQLVDEYAREISLPLTETILKLHFKPRVN